MHIYEVSMCMSLGVAEVFDDTSQKSRCHQGRDLEEHVCIGVFEILFNTNYIRLRTYMDVTFFLLIFFFFSTRHRISTFTLVVFSAYAFESHDRVNTRMVRNKRGKAEFTPTSSSNLHLHLTLLCTPSIKMNIYVCKYIFDQ